jgi:hypothetical protein
LALSVAQFAAEPSAKAVQHPIHKRLSIDVPGEISAVFWSASRDVTYDSAVHICFIPVREGKPQPPHPKTQVWLLKGDGTVILPTATPDTTRIGNAGSVTELVSYIYKRLEAAEAVAVAVSIAGRFFIERLPEVPK